MFAQGSPSQPGDGSGIGNTAGNSTVIHGLWNPGLVMQVNGENIDNRRVKIFFGGLGENFWSIGQGNQTITYDALDPSEIDGSNEKRRRHFNVAGKTNGASAYQNKWVVRQDNGYQGWNIAEPEYDYHLTSNGNVVGQVLMVLNNRDAGENARLRVEDSTGSAFTEIRGDGNGDSRILMGSDSGNNGQILYDSGDRFLISTPATANAFQIGADGECFAKTGINGGRFTTVDRNALTGISFGTMVFDSTLAKPIWYDSPGVWRDATGAAV